jgi:hypothetical protein
MFRPLLFGVLAAVLGSANLAAQEFSRFPFSIGGGFTSPVLATGSDANTGWNVRLGAGYNFAVHFGVMLDFGFDYMGLSIPTDAPLSYAAGDIGVFSATLDPVVHLTPKRRGDLYVTGGGGYFRQEFTFWSRAGGIIPTGTTPAFGFYPNASGFTFIPDAYSINKPGLNAGVGISFWNKWGGRFFAEVRYVNIFAGSYHIDYIPVTFGFRR